MSGNGCSKVELKKKKPCWYVTGWAFSCPHSSIFWGVTFSFFFSPFLPWRLFLKSFSYKNSIKR